jgi:hypothetical protein
MMGGGVDQMAAKLQTAMLNMKQSTEHWMSLWIIFFLLEKNIYIKIFVHIFQLN